MDYNHLLNYVNYRTVATNSKNAEVLFEKIGQIDEMDNFLVSVKSCNVTTEHLRGKIKAPFKFLLPCAYKNTNFLSMVLGIPMQKVDGIARGSLCVVPTPNANAFDGNWKIFDIREFWGKSVKESRCLTFGDAFEYMLSKVNAQELLQELQSERQKWGLNYKRIQLESRIFALEFVIKNKIVLTDFVTDRIIVIPSTFNTLSLNLPTCYYSKAEAVYANAFFEFERYINKTDKSTYSKLFQFSAGRLIFIIEHLFEFFDDNQITFKNNLLLVSDFLNGICDFELYQSHNGVKAVLPINFKNWEKPIEIYIELTKNGYLLSDNGYVFEYLDEFCDYDYIKDENKFDSILENNGVSFKNHCFTKVIKSDKLSEKKVQFFAFVKTLIAIISHYDYSF